MVECVVLPAARQFRSRRARAGALAVVVALAATGCSSSELPEITIYVESDAATPRPEYLLFNWLWCRSFIRRDERVPESGTLPASGSPLASIRVKLDARSPTKRGIFLRGMVGETMVSAGIAVADVVPGEANQVTVRLGSGALAHSSADGVPDMVDWCAEARNPDAGGDGAGAPAGADAGAGGVDAGAGGVDGGGGGGNQPPVVNAGAPVTLASPAGEAMLAGAVTDDGLPNPPGRVTARWSQVSGPGMTTFRDPEMAATTARFSTSGSYVLRLTGNDGAASASADVTVEVLGLEDGLAGIWRFEDGSGTTARDSSGGNNHATLQGPAAFVRPGRIGMGALDVGGDMDRALVMDPANDRLDFGMGDFSLAVWVKTAQMPTAAPDIVVKWPVSGGSEGRSGYALTMPGGSALFKAYTGGTSGETAQAMGPAINDNRWHHLVGRKTATELALFVDGKQVAVVKHMLGAISNTAPLQFGAFGVGAAYDFDGSLDEVRLYSRALSAAEIAALAAAP